MDVQAIIDTSTSVNATTLGAADAGEIYRASVNACYVIEENLSPKQKAILRKYIDFPIIYKPKVTPSSDHPLLMTMRNLIRQVYNKSFSISNIMHKALVIGATTREMKLYDGNPAISFYLHGSESKDYDRIVVGALKDISKHLLKKTNRSQRKLAATATTIPNVVKRYDSLKKILDDYQTLGSRPPRYHTSLIEAETLLFEDSFYNFSGKDYYDLFEKTGANIAYGYGLLPMELLHGDMPENSLYRIIRHTDPMSKTAVSFVYTGGYTNGYRHELSAWSTLLESPVVKPICPNASACQLGQNYKYPDMCLCTGSNRCKPYPFSLVVEITTRMGPFAVFKIIRSYANQLEVRSLDLPASMEYVKCLDIQASVDVHTGSVKSPLVYYSVYSNEFYELLNYLLSLDPKSMTVSTALMSIRRRAGGISLTNQEIMPPWELPKSRFFSLAMTTWVFAKTLREVTDSSLESLGIGSKTAKFKHFLSEAIKYTPFFPIYFVGELLYNMIMQKNLVQQIVLHGASSRLQYGMPLHVEYNKPRNGHRNVASNVTNFRPIFPELTEEFDNPCAYCRDVLTPTVLTSQKVKCDCKHDSEVVFEMTTEELNSVRNNLAATENVEPWLRELKLSTIEDVPKVAFKHSVTLRVIRGGPGTGKSTIIRRIADTADLILCPFRKLKEEYTNVEIEGSSERVSFNFKTPDKAMKTRGHRRIFIDEYTGVNFDYIKMIAYLNSAEEVILVGDELQTGVREPEEGKYIWNHLKIETFDIHTLLVNFRNQPQNVWILNRMGYNLECNKQYDGENRILVIKNEDLPESRVLKLGFSQNTCDLYELGGDTKATVRANQGQGYDKVAIYLCATDGALLMNDKLVRVAMSRAKECTYLVTDDSAEAQAFIARLRLDEFSCNDLPVFGSNDEINDNEDQVEPLLEAFINSCSPDHPVNEEVRSMLRSMISQTPSVLPALFSANHNSILESTENLTEFFSTISEEGVSLNSQTNTEEVQNEDNSPGQEDNSSSNSESSSTQPLQSESAETVLRNVLRSNQPEEESAEHILNTSNVAHNNEETQQVPVGRRSLDSPPMQSRPVLVKRSQTLNGFLKMFIKPKESNSNNTVDEQIVTEELPAYVDERSSTEDQPVIDDAVDDPVNTNTDNTLTVESDAPQPNPLLADRFDSAVAEYEQSLNYDVMQTGGIVSGNETNQIVEASQGSDVNPVVSPRPSNPTPNQSAPADDFVVSETMPSIGTNQEYVDTFSMFMPTPRETVTRLPTPVDIQVTSPREMQTGRDAFTELRSFVAAIGDVDTQTSMNHASSTVVPGAFSNGSISADFLNPINPRGHPKEVKSRYYSFANGTGLHFGGHKVMQELQCIQARYAGSKPKYEFTHDSQLLANKIADLFVDEYMNVDAPIDSALMTTIMNEAIEAAKSKSYEAQFVGFDNPDHKLIRFHLKDIYKPSPAKDVDINKAGQGISAWSKDAQVMFGAAIRMVNVLFKRMSKSNLIYDNRETEEEIRNKITAAVEYVPSTALDGITDWGQFDAVQNKFTQAIERRILTKMNISDEFQEMYYQYRNNYTIQASNSRFRARSEKTSGEPGTLLFNTMLSGPLSNYLLRGEGPSVMVIKGDDGYKKQCNLKVVEERRLEVAQHVQSGMKLSVGLGAEFCGNVIIDGQCYPSIYRKAHKLVAHRFRDYKHFTEYQISLRDWVKKNSDDNSGYQNLISINARMYNSSVEQTKALFEAIQSTAHIDEEQFLANWTYREEGHIHLTADGTVHFD